MPKIIGTNPDHEVDCRNCGVRMTFTRDEVRPGDAIPGDEDGDHYGVITCPQCQKAVRTPITFSREDVERLRAEEMREY